MKKTLLFIALLAGTLSLSQAQPRQRASAEEMAQRNVEQLEKRLNLTADQKAKVYTVVLAQAKSRDSLFTAARNGGDREAMRTKMTALQEENDKQISALLTDEQKKTYEEWVKERQSRMRDGRGGRDGNRPAPRD